MVIMFGMGLLFLMGSDIISLMSIQFFGMDLNG